MFPAFEFACFFGRGAAGAEICELLANVDALLRGRVEALPELQVEPILLVLYALEVVIWNDPLASVLYAHFHLRVFSRLLSGALEWGPFFFNVVV